MKKKKKKPYNKPWSIKETLKPSTVLHCQITVKEINHSYILIDMMIIGQTAILELKMLH